jgi:hypothetical protein
MRTLFFNRDLLNPLRYGAFAWKLLSHKLSRWLVPLSAIPALAGLFLLAPAHPLMRWALGAAILMAALAVIAARWPNARPVPRFLPVAILGALAANLAVLHAWLRFFQGRESRVWEPTRRLTTHPDGTG